MKTLMVLTLSSLFFTSFGAIAKDIKIPAAAVSQVSIQDIAGNYELMIEYCFDNISKVLELIQEHFCKQQNE